MSLPSTQSAVLESSSESTVTPPLSKAALSALQRGQITDAIRLVRTEQHIGVQDATHQIDRYLKAQPAIKQRIERVHADTREGLFRWIVFLLIGGVGLAYVLI